MSYNEINERFEHHAYQCRGMVKSAIIGFLGGLVASIMILGTPFDGGLEGIFSWLISVLLLDLLLGLLGTVVASIFVIKEGKFALHTVLGGCTKALVVGAAGGLMGSGPLVALAAIPLILYAGIAGTLIAVCCAVLPITTIYHAVQYFRYKKMLAV